MSQVWFAIGCLGMAFGALIFGIGAHNAQNERWRILFTLNFFIAAIASVLYLTMWTGHGQSIVYDRPTYWVRYVTWICSTPLQILSVTYLGGTSLAFTSALVGADILMIATGFVATMSPKPINYIWYIVSCGFFIGMFYMLFNQYRSQASEKHPRSRRVFTKLITVHFVLWLIYPVIWILGNTGFNLISSTVETASYTILDVVAKVGFGFLALNCFKQLDQAGEAPRLERVFS